MKARNPTKVAFEKSLGTTPTTTRFGHSTIDKICSRNKTAPTLKCVCKSCGGIAWVKIWNVQKYGRDNWTCRACRKTSRAEVLQARINIEKRRAKIKARR